MNQHRIAGIKPEIKAKLLDTESHQQEQNDSRGPLPLPMFHHQPSYAYTAKSKLSPINNPCTQQSLKVAIQMPSVNMHGLRCCQL